MPRFSAKELLTNLKRNIFGCALLLALSGWAVATESHHLEQGLGVDRSEKHKMMISTMCQKLIF